MCKIRDLLTIVVNKVLPKGEDYLRLRYINKNIHNKY